MIAAHENPLAALAFNLSATQLATASEKVNRFYIMLNVQDALIHDIIPIEIEEMCKAGDKRQYQF